MFTALGSAATKHARATIFTWIVLTIIGAIIALWGFGGGSLFDRMKTAESFVPGSESDKVFLAEKAATDGENVMVVVTGVDIAQATAEVADLREDLLAQGPVDDVFDPVTVDETFQRELDEAHAEALTKALDAAEKEIPAQIDTAVAAALNAAVTEAMAPQEAQLAFLPAEQRSAVEAQIRADIEPAVRAQVEPIVREEVLNAATEEAERVFAKEVAALANPADDLKKAGAFLIAVNMAPSVDVAAFVAVEEAIDSFEAALKASNPDAEVSYLSSSIILNTVIDQVKKDMVRGEVISMPVAAVLMLLVFGGLLAAGLPLAGAVVAIVLSMATLWGLTIFTEVDTFVLNILTIIGLALSIDYGLLVVSRFREEMTALLADSHPSEGTSDPESAGHLVKLAVERTVNTAGRTVLFSALTIALSISSLIVMAAPTLRMVAVGGMLVTLFAVMTAVTLVPALISVLGTRLLRPSPITRVPGLRAIFRVFSDTSSEDGVFSRLAKWVHARPLPVLVVVTAFLVASLFPLAGMQLRTNVMDYLPADSAPREALATLREEFPEKSLPTATVFVPSSELAVVESATLSDSYELDEAAAASVERLTDEIAQVDGVRLVSDPEVTSVGTFVRVWIEDADSVGPQAVAVVEAIRGLTPGFEHFVGGTAALQQDFWDSIVDGAPLAATIIVVSVTLLLFLLLGSIVAPIKALIINTLSLFASIGLGALFFHYGWFGLPAYPGLEIFVLACAVAFGFGLAMDYEVFLIARIKEYYDQGYDNEEAVELGLQKSGRIITAAAAIIVAVFIGFVTGEVLSIKEIGVVLALIVVVDATIVRMLLVPSLMTFMGKWNWWAPAPLARLAAKLDIKH